MLDVEFWFDQAAIFREQAEAVPDSEAREEYRELARVCTTVAHDLEKHTPGG